MRLSGAELIMVLAVVILLFGVFGARRLPDAARSIGRSMRIFKSEVKEMRKDDSDATVPPTSGHTEPRATELEGRIVDPRDAHRVTDAQGRQP